jgi:phage gpG-like protein
MNSFTIEVKDLGVSRALKATAQRFKNLNPVLQAVGEGIVERTKRRFDTSTDPDGQPWTPNSAATLGMLSARLAGSKGNVKKDGSLNAKGIRALANKKPLIGESQQLRMQIVAAATNSALTVSTTSVTAKYAAVQHFGGQAGRNRSVTIPARPFFPIKKDGSLYPREQAEVVDALNDYLAADL